MPILVVKDGDRVYATWLTLTAFKEACMSDPRGIVLMGPSETNRTICSIYGGYQYHDVINSDENLHTGGVDAKIGRRKCEGDMCVDRAFLGSYYTDGDQGVVRLGFDVTGWYKWFGAGGGSSLELSTGDFWRLNLLRIHADFRVPLHYNSVGQGVDLNLTGGGELLGLNGLSGKVNWAPNAFAALGLTTVF